MSEPDYDARMMEHLVRELEPYGIGPDRLTIAYVDDWQDYDVLVDGGPLTDAQIDGVMKAMSMGGCFRFTDDENTARWHEALGCEGRKIMVAMAAEARVTHPGLPRFDRSSQTLPDFLRSLEIWAGAEPGSHLIALDAENVHVAHRPGSPPNLDQIGRLVLILNILEEQGIKSIMGPMEAIDEE